MLYLKGQPRDQLVLYTTCLEEMIPPDNSVRLIDAFVAALDLRQLGFAPLPPEPMPAAAALAYNLKRLFYLGYRPTTIIETLLHPLKASMQLYKAFQRGIQLKILFLGYALFFSQIPKVEPSLHSGIN